MVTITKNESFNSYELLFDGKPSQAIRDILKSNGYKWHNVRKIWFGYKDITEALNKALNGDNAVRIELKDGREIDIKE